MRLLNIALLASLSACSPSQPQLSTLPTRGEAIAARLCSGCHAVGFVEYSARTAAPPFRDLALRYNELSLERKLSEINGKPHFEMPPITLDNAEITELANYIAQLR